MGTTPGQKLLVCKITSYRCIKERGEQRAGIGRGDDFSSFSRIGGRKGGGHDCQDERGNRFHKWWTLRDLRLILIITRFRSSLRGPLLYPLFIRWLAPLVPSAAYLGEEGAEQDEWRGREDSVARP